MSPVIVNERQVHCGEILHLLDNPDSDHDAIQYLPDGALLVTEGHIEAIGERAVVLSQLPDDIPVFEHRNALITPGFIDCHVHYPQYNVIASYGEQLLDWLNRYTFPEEAKFSDAGYASAIASRFLDTLIDNGTTTALVFGSVHPQSVTAFFEEALRREMRMICGKVMMDRNAPANLLDTPEDSVAQSENLIKQWHKRDRLGYAVTPRFALTSSEQQLKGAAGLLRKYDDVLLHTHLAENAQECANVAELFPEHRSYLDVYHQYGLTGSRSVFAHSIYLDKEDWKCMQQSGSAVAHCPTSNLFIGSGLFSLQDAIKRNINTGLGTDIGGGDSYSLFRVINEAYKVQQLQNFTLEPMTAFYLSTLGAARTLRLDKHIGNFEPGKEADFNVLDYTATPVLKHRIAETNSVNEKLFVLQMLGDDRAVRQTWINGKPAN